MTAQSIHHDKLGFPAKFAQGGLWPATRSAEQARPVSDVGAGVRAMELPDVRVNLAMTGRNDPQQ